jgi:hypothetical protein
LESLSISSGTLLILEVKEEDTNGSFSSLWRSFLSLLLDNILIVCHLDASAVCAPTFPVGDFNNDDRKGDNDEIDKTMHQSCCICSEAEAHPSKELLAADGLDPEWATAWARGDTCVW